MIKGALFDFGGTIDTDGLHWLQMFSMAYQSCGLSVVGLREAYIHAERTLGRNPIIKPDFTFRDTLRTKISLQQDCLCMRADAERILDFCYSHAADNIRNVSAPVLRRLAERMPLVLVSNFYGNMHTVLREFGIDGLFADVVESSVVGVRKPDPEIYSLGVKSLGLMPEECVAVGDSPDKDITPASSIGCETVWLSVKGWSDSATCHPTHTIASMRNFPETYLR